MSDYKQEYQYRKHEMGFDVFIAEESLYSLDEYKDHDPFDIENNTDSEFHKQRVNCTIELINSIYRRFEKPKILDIGCGQGHITTKIKEKFPDSQIFGIDHSLTGINDAVKNCLGCQFAVADAYQMPFTDDSFEIIVCNNMWEHIHAPTQLLGEVKRLLKKEGYFIMSTPNRFKFANILRVLRGKETGKIPKHHITEYTLGQVKEQFRFCGFEIVRISHKKTRLKKITHRILYSGLNLYLKLMKSEYHLDNTTVFLVKLK